MKNICGYIEEGFYQNTKTDVCGIINDHLMKRVSRWETIFSFSFENGTYYLNADRLGMAGRLADVLDVKMDIDKNIIKFLYKAVTAKDTNRVIYIESHVNGIPDSESVSVVFWIGCYECRHDVWWEGKPVGGNKIKVARCLKRNEFRLDEGFYTNTHSRVVDQLNDKIWKTYCMNKDGQENYYFTLDHGVLELHIRKLDYSAHIDYEDIEISLSDTERDEIFRLLQECNKFRWRVEYTMLAKDKYRIMLKVYDGDTYIYHVSLKVPPQKMAVYRVDKKQLSLSDFIK